MLIKAKASSTHSDPRQRAGDDAERQMAFLLDRRFEERDDIFLLHDLRILKGKSAFQIDHLVITRYGIILIESKSIHGKVSIIRHDEQREHWSREFRGREEGIPSPVRQVEEQARLLKDFLSESREKILSKLLFVLQKGFGFCPFDTYVGVSTLAVFNLAAGTPLPEHVFKADEVAPEIDRSLKAREKQNTLLMLNPLAEMPWAISRDDALATARFLLSRHMPLFPAKENELVPSEPALQRSTVIPTPPPVLPRAGETCPACGKHVLAVAAGGPIRADGSRERFLACLGNRDASCTWIAPLDAAPMLAHGAEAVPESSVEPVAPVRAHPESSKKYYCYGCKASIPDEVAKFCWDRQARFGGKAYCRSCQQKFARIRGAAKASATIGGSQA